MSNINVDREIKKIIKYSLKQRSMKGGDYRENIKEHLSNLKHGGYGKTQITKMMQKGGADVETLNNDIVATDVKKIDDIIDQFVGKWRSVLEEKDRKFTELAANQDRVIKEKEDQAAAMQTQNNAAVDTAIEQRIHDIMERLTQTISAKLSAILEPLPLGQVVSQSSDKTKEIATP